MRRLVHGTRGWGTAVHRGQGGQAQLDAAEAALTTFEEEARRAGVPPGWLR